MEYLERDRRTSAAELAHPGLRPVPPTPRRLPQLGRSLAPLLVTAVLLATWEVGVRIGAIDALLFTPPTTIARTTGRLLANGVLLDHLGVTALRVGLAVLTGGGTGLLLGIAMGCSTKLRAAIDPFIAGLHPVPKIAILPLIMVIFGIGNASLIIVIATGAFFPMLINTMGGVAQIAPVHHDVATLFRANRWTTLRRVVIPGSAPAVLAGLRLAMNTALLIAVAVEMIASRQGLGAMIWLSWTTFRTEEIYVAIAATVAFGLLVNGLISMLMRFALPWQQRGEPDP